MISERGHCWYQYTRMDMLRPAEWNKQHTPVPYELHGEQATDTRCSHFNEELWTVVYAYVISARHVQPRRQIKYCIALEPCKMSIVNMHLCPAKMSLLKKSSVSNRNESTAKKDALKWHRDSGTTHWELPCCRFQIKLAVPLRETPSDNTVTDNTVRTFISCVKFSPTWSVSQGNRPKSITLLPWLKWNQIQERRNCIQNLLQLSSNF